MPDMQSPPRRQPEHLSSARLFVGDAEIAFRLLNEARYRIMTRVFGMPREHSNLMTLFVVAASVRALRRAAAAPGTQVRKARSSPTAVGDTMIGVSVAKETVNGIAGRPARDMPFAAALIALAMTVYALRAGIKPVAPRGEAVVPPRRSRGAQSAGRDASLGDLTVRQRRVARGEHPRRRRGPRARRRCRFGLRLSQKNRRCELVTNRRRAGLASANEPRKRLEKTSRRQVAFSSRPSLTHRYSSSSPARCELATTMRWPTLFVRQRPWRHVAPPPMRMRILVAAGLTPARLGAVVRARATAWRRSLWNR